MKKTQLYGITAIALGVLLVIPTFLAAFGIAGESASYLDIIEDADLYGKAFDTHIFVMITLILTLISAAALIVYGILLLLDKETLLKHNMIITIIAGVLALAVFVTTLLFIGEMGDLSNITFDLGFGAILFAIIGVLSIASSFVLKAVKK